MTEQRFIRTEEGILQPISPIVVEPEKEEVEEQPTEETEEEQPVEEEQVVETKPEKPEYIETYIEGTPKKKPLFDIPEMFKARKNELSELFEKPTTSDPDIYTDDLVELDEEDIMGEDLDDVVEVDEEQIMGGDLSNVTEVSEDYVMGYRKKKKPKKKKYRLPPGMGGLRT